MTSPVMQVRLRASYGNDSVLKDVEFELCAGEALGIVGTSGAGKTTLAMALLGLLPWRGAKAYGEVLLDGCNLLAMRAREARRLRGRRIAFVPQSPMTALNGAVSLQAHFDEAWRAHESSGRKGLAVRVRQLMEEVQLPIDDESFLRRKSGQISVGQAQRILIALALLHRPAIVVADEPTSALDPATQAEIIRLLLRLTRTNGTALVYISHDLVSVLQLCHRLAVLHAGVLVESIRVAEISQAKHPATLRLLHSLPVPVEVLLSYCRADVSGDPQGNAKMEATESSLNARSAAMQDGISAQLSQFEAFFAGHNQKLS
jgi:ABC-type glutathione transport system ATPase component